MRKELTIISNHPIVTSEKVNFCTQTRELLHLKRRISRAFPARCFTAFDDLLMYFSISEKAVIYKLKLLWLK